jgi:hypothetical protein
MLSSKIMSIIECKNNLNTYPVKAVASTQFKNTKLGLIGSGIAAFHQIGHHRQHFIKLGIIGSSPSISSRKPSNAVHHSSSQAPKKS